MATNLQMLGDALTARMKSTAGAATKTVAELGTINGNMSLACDSLGSAIPKGQYMVATNLLESGPTITGPATIQSEEHTHEIQAAHHTLSPGDRVLVVWCGNDAVVTAIVSAS